MDRFSKDMGYFPNAAGHRVERPEGAATYILIFVESGQGWLELSGRHSLNSGDVVLIPPDKAHAYGADPEDPWKIYWFHFDGHGARALLKWTPFTEKTPSSPSPLIDSIRRHFHTALATVERGYSDHTLLELSLALINLLTLLHSKNPNQVKERENQRIERVMDAMRRDLEDPKTLPYYAKQSGFSVSRFSEIFKKHCGVSPMTYYTEMRIQRACELLDKTDLQIGEIAQRIGFEDSLYFSRLFRKHAGMPPSAYRKLGIG